MQSLRISKRGRKNKVLIKFDKKEVSLDKYAGQWVAFLGKRIVGNSKSLKKLAKEMEKKGLLNKVSFFAVPPKGYLAL